MISVLHHVHVHVHFRVHAYVGESLSYMYESSKKIYETWWGIAVSRRSLIDFSHYPCCIQRTSIDVCPSLRRRLFRTSVPCRTVTQRALTSSGRSCCVVRPRRGSPCSPTFPPTPASCSASVFATVKWKSLEEFLENNRSTVDPSQLTVIFFGNDISLVYIS